MVARFHYDDRVYRRLLHNELGPQEGDVVSHVEACDDCQARLEEVSQEGISWGDVREYLRPDAPTMTYTPDGAIDAADTERKHRQTDVGFLSPSERPGSIGRLGRYEIESILGRGGMGVVLKGFDPALNRHCAIKVLAPALATSGTARGRFAREAKSAAAVVHEHVVPIQNVDEEAGLPYLVMPLVQGKSLEQRLQHNGPLEVKEILRIGMQAASGLAAAHAQGLVHRDVKPANILLENGVERVKLTDFGLARAADDANMTQSGTISGTPQYMSPEQARGETVDHRSDLFSLGSVLYAMCTGRSPFRADNSMAVLNRISHDEPRQIREVNPDIPPWLQDIVDKLLAKDPSQRYQSADEVEEVLGDWLAHVQKPDSVPPPPAPPKTSTTLPPVSNRFRWRSATVAIGGVLAFALFAVVVILELNKGSLVIEAEGTAPVRIRKGDQVYDRLTVDAGATTIRIAAGEYVVEIEGNAADLQVEDNRVTIRRGGTQIVKVVTRSEELPDVNAAASSTNPSQIHLGDSSAVDLPRWQGTWKAAAWAGGGWIPYELKVKDNRCVVTWANGLSAYSIYQLAFNLVASPDQFVLTTPGRRAAPGNRNTIRGIYRFNEAGDHLTLCYREAESEGSDAVPEDFKAASGVMLCELRKVIKPAAEIPYVSGPTVEPTKPMQRTVHDDAEDLVGVWKLQDASGDNDPYTMRFEKRIVFLTMQFPSNSGEMQEGEVTLHSKGDKSRFTVVVRGPDKAVKQWVGTYELRGDELTWTFTAVNVSGHRGQWNWGLAFGSEEFSPRHVTGVYRRVKQTPAKVELLDKTLSVDFNQIPLRDVMGYIEQQAGVNIAVDDKALAEAGIADDHPVTLKVENVRLGSLMNLICRPLGLTWCERGEILYVVVAKFVPAETQVYHVVELVKLKTLGDWSPEFCEIVKRVIDPHSWEEHGGVGTVMYLPPGNAAVYHDAPHQRQVQELLRMLHRAREVSQPAHGSDPGVQAIGTRSDATDKINQALQQSISLELREIPLADVAEYLRNRLAINVLVDDGAADKQVTFTVSNAALGPSLELMLAPLNMTYLVTDDVLLLTDKLNRAQERIIRVYPVAKLLTPAGQQEGWVNEGKSLVHTVQIVIEPESWSDAGGSGEIFFHAPSRSLVIAQPQAIHRQIERMLSRASEEGWPSHGKQTQSLQAAGEEAKKP